MAVTHEQQENKLVKTIKRIMQMPNKDVSVYSWVDKYVFPASKITVHAGDLYFVLEDIPCNSFSMDIEVNGKKLWVTTLERVAELIDIKNLLLQHQK